MNVDKGEDEIFVERARNGDAVAFDLLVGKYSRRIYALVFHMTSNHADSDDLLQEVFSRAYRSLKRFKGKSSFYTWLYAIAVNLTLNHLRKRRRRSTVSLDNLAGAGGPAEWAVDMSVEGNPERMMRIHEIQERLNKALQELSDDHRTVVILHDIQGLSHIEISRILGVSHGTIRSRLHYAHRLLQVQLGDLLE